MDEMLSLPSEILPSYPKNMTKADFIPSLVTSNPFYYLK